MRKVRDHDHLNGKFRGYAHSICNLKCKNQKSIQLVFHNLQNNDAHLFIKQIAKEGEHLDCIPQNDQKYISFSKLIQVDKKLRRMKMVTLKMKQ